MTGTRLQCEIVRRRSRGSRIASIGVAFALFVGAAQVVGMRAIRCFGASKLDIARAVVDHYAYEAYPQWETQHPGRTCPRRLDELNEYTNNKDTKDPWGNRYRMFCLPEMPPGLRPIVVTSDGEDGLEGTPDDIRSWER